jgi:mannose-1-phosphate guanylyltransferase/phosphomannomutase
MASFADTDREKSKKGGAVPNLVPGQAVILSAGLGTRLQSLFPDIPKVMVPLGGKPLLEWHVKQLKKHGVREIFINLHYLPDVITNHFGDGSKWGVKITYVLEKPEILGTAGGFKNFSAEGGSLPVRLASLSLRRSGQAGASGGDGPYLKGDFFVVYGDVFSLIDYAKMAEAYRRHPEAIAMTIVGKNDHPHDSDLVKVDSDLRFIKIYPKPNPTLPTRHSPALPACHGEARAGREALAGGPENWRALRTTFIFDERVLKYIPPKTYYEIDHQLLPDLLAKGEPVYGYETTDYIKDIGTPERYREVEEYLETRRKQL